jgi:hypothetical protein
MKRTFDPGETIVFLMDNKRLIEREGNHGIGIMMARGATYMYLSYMESRHVIVEKDFVKIEDAKRKRENY